MRRVHQLITLLNVDVLPKGLNDISDPPSLGVPKHQPPARLHRPN
jgi:hypothetical protein